MKQFCAECGRAMHRNPEHGAWLLCCQGRGYWCNYPPLKRDLELIKPTFYNGYWFYRTGKWIQGHKPTRPRGV